MVRRKWVWLLIFSPLWASIFFNFGLAPVLERTSDSVPVAEVVGAFVAAAGGIAFLPALLMRGAGGGGGASDKSS